MTALLIFVFAAALLIVFYVIANVFFNVGIPRSANYFCNNGAPDEISVWHKAEARAVTPSAEDEKLEAYNNCESETDAAIEFINSKKPERIYINSYDGLKLCAHLIENPDARATVMMVHGFRSHGLTDFALAVPYFYNAGCSCVIIDQRSHEESEGKYICFGAKEKYDIKAWTEYFAERFSSRPIILDGVSMGAATVMLAAGLELPKEVRGIISDCGFTTPQAIFDSVLKQKYRIHPALVLPIAGLLVWRRAGFRLSGAEADTKAALRKNRMPMLFVHGEADDFVPYDMGLENYETARDYCDAEFLSVPEAGHACSFLTDRRKYIAAINRLFVKCGLDIEIKPDGGVWG